MRPARGHFVFQACRPSDGSVTVAAIVLPIPSWASGLPLRAAALCLSLGLVLLAACRDAALAADLPDVPEYSIGDRAAADVVTPTALVVFDPTQTEWLRRAEGQKVAPFFRVLPGTPEESEEALRAGFVAMRTAFSESLRAVFGHPVPLLTAEYAQPRFKDALESFRKQHPDFPLSQAMTEQWAFGNSAEPVLEEWRQLFRKLAVQHVREDALPEGERLTTSSVRFLVEPLPRNLSLAEAESRSQTLPRTNLLTLTQARQDSLGAAGEADRRRALRWLVEFLRPNCVLELDLTQQARARRAEAIHVVDRYEAGQALVKEGQPITAKVQRALAELRAQTAAMRTAAAAARERAERSRVQAEAAAAQQTAEATRRTNRWLEGGLLASALLMALLLWQARRRRRAAARDWPAQSMPAQWSGEASSLVPATDAAGAASGELAWRERALAAEARADKATAMLRSGLLPHLARWMMGELVRRLVSHRSTLLAEQTRAESEVSDLAMRLEQLKTPIEERLRAYEKRITELESELAAKGAQNAELIKAKIESTRKKLAAERGEPPASWN